MKPNANLLCKSVGWISRMLNEQRMICFGFLAGRMVAVGYVQRGETRHIFSMRKANEREQNRFA